MSYFELLFLTNVHRIESYVYLQGRSKRRRRGRRSRRERGKRRRIYLQHLGNWLVEISIPTDASGTRVSNIVRIYRIESSLRCITFRALINRRKHIELSHGISATSFCIR